MIKGKWQNDNGSSLASQLRGMQQLAQIFGALGSGPKLKPGGLAKQRLPRRSGPVAGPTVRLPQGSAQTIQTGRSVSLVTDRKALPSTHQWP